MAGKHGSLCPTNLFRKLVEELNMSIIVYAIPKALKGLSKTYVACWGPNRSYLDPFISVMMYSPLWMRPYRHVTFISHPVSLLPSLPRLLLLSQIDRHLFCPYDSAATMPYFPSLLTNKLKQFKYNRKHKRQENIRRNPRLKAPIRLLNNTLLDLTVSPSNAIVRM